MQVHGALDLRIVFAELNRNRLGTNDFADDFVACGVLALTDHTSQQIVIEHKSVHTPRLQQHEAFEMVLAHQRLELDVLGIRIFAQNLHRCRACRGGHFAALQLLERGQVRVRTHRHAHFADVSGQTKGNLLLPVQVIGHAGAIEIGRAVADQRHGVLRRQHHVFELGLGRNRLHHTLAQLHVIADKLLIGTQRIDHGRRCFAHTEHHRAARLPALQRGRLRHDGHQISAWRCTTGRRCWRTRRRHCYLSGAQRRYHPTAPIQQLLHTCPKKPKRR